MTEHTVRRVILVLLACLVLSAGVSHAGTWVYLRFEEGGGTTALDSSGNSHNGTFFEDRGPTYVSGDCFLPVKCIPRTNEPNLHALFFDGVDRTAVTVPDPLATGPLTGVTVEFWVLYYSVTGRTTVGKQAGGCCKNTIQVELNRGQDRNLTSFNITDQAFVEHILLGPAIPRGRWVHVAATWSATTTLMKLYYDGVLVASQSVSGTSLYEDGNPLLIGAENDETLGGGPKGGWFNGYLDELRISDVALEPNQFLNWPPAGSTAVGADGASSRLVAPRITLESPQPASTEVPVRFAVDTAAPLSELFVVDVGGRVVHRWSPEALSAASFSWSPGSRDGRVAAGTYWLRALTTEGTSSATKVVLVGR